MGPVQSSLDGSRSPLIFPYESLTCFSSERIKKTAKELSEATGSRCIPAQADVRYANQLQAAVALTIETFGRIDFVICGMSYFPMPRFPACNRLPFLPRSPGAAGNFLAPISGLSENAFRTVIEIDTVSSNFASSTARVFCVACN